MRITENRLRRIIRNVIKESNFMYPDRYDDAKYVKSRKVESVLRYHNNQPVNMDNFIMQITDACTLGKPEFSYGISDRAHELVYQALEDYGSFDGMIPDHAYGATKGAYHASFEDADAVWSIDPKMISTCAGAIRAACARV